MSRRPSPGRRGGGRTRPVGTATGLTLHDLQIVSRVLGFRSAEDLVGSELWLGTSGNRPSKAGTSISPTRPEPLPSAIEGCPGGGKGPHHDHNICRHPMTPLR